MKTVFLCMDHQWIAHRHSIWQPLEKVLDLRSKDMPPAGWSACYAGGRPALT